MRNYMALLLVLCSCLSYAQNWVDTLYQIQTESDIIYGSAIDFAGNQRDLKLDISYPTNDTAPECGRPLLVIIHGGAWIAGDKNQGVPQFLRKDFAKRGFTTASISYRLGLFQTHQQVHCNTQVLGLEWDCMNMADTSEWYRAYYRGIQDANGAIRWLVNNAAQYNIDPNNIFLVGESAGGYIAMGAGFIDDNSEVLNTLVGSMTSVQAPNNIYDGPCVQGYGLDTNIASMDLSRSALGTYDGSLNYPANEPYKIQAVGNFYGGTFNNIFGTQNGTPPALYLFHQPNDLIVPYNTNKLLAGFAACATQFPLNCAYIINRPTTMGSNAIVNLLLTMQSNNQTIPDYVFDPTSNNADCFAQAGNPSLSGHALDSYWLRSTNMASFFATKVTECNSVGVSDRERREFKVYPNPAHANSLIFLEGTFRSGEVVSVYNVLGEKIHQQTVNSTSTQQNIELGEDLSKGIYFIKVGEGLRKLVID